MPEGTVRLACVRHAASVRSEPGSNSQVRSKELYPASLVLKAIKRSSFKTQPSDTLASDTQARRLHVCFKRETRTPWLSSQRVQTFLQNSPQGAPKIKPRPGRQNAAHVSLSSSLYSIVKEHAGNPAPETTNHRPSIKGVQATHSTRKNKQRAAQNRTGRLLQEFNQFVTASGPLIRSSEPPEGSPSDLSRFPLPRPPRRHRRRR